jgi:hypothetical protein
VSQHEDSGNPKRNPGNAFQSIGEEGGLVVVPEHSKVEVLNPVGSKIFSMLDGNHSRDEIVRAIVDEFDVTEDQAKQDLEQFLLELKKSELLAQPGEGGGAHE